MEVKTIEDVLPLEPGHERSDGYLRGFIIHTNIPILISTLVHETAHHIHWEKHPIMTIFHEPHGKEFREIEQKLFDYLLKNPDN